MTELPKQNNSLFRIIRIVRVTAANSGQGKSIHYAAYIIYN